MSGCAARPLTAPSRIFGVDSGAKGAICVLQGDRILALINMPLDKKRKPDLRALVNFINQWQNGSSIAFIEKMQARPRTSKRALMGMAANARTVSDAFKYCGVPVREVPNQTWQSAMLKGIRGVDSKVKSMKVAQALFPLTEFTTDHQADASLLAAWGQRHQ